MVWDQTILDKVPNTLLDTHIDHFVNTSNPLIVFVHI